MRSIVQGGLPIDPDTCIVKSDPRGNGLATSTGEIDMGLKISDRSKISPFIVMDVMRSANTREATGVDVLHLEVGQPSTPVAQASN